MCVVVPRASWQGRPLRSPVASLWPWCGNRHRAFPHQWGDFRSPQTPSTQHPIVCSGKAEGACLPLGTQPPPARQGSVPAPLDPMTISSRPTCADWMPGMGLETCLSTLHPNHAATVWPFHRQSSFYADDPVSVTIASFAGKWISFPLESCVSIGYTHCHVGKRFWASRPR